MQLKTLSVTSVADLGIRCFLDPWIRIRHGKQSEILDHISESFVKYFGLKYLNSLSIQCCGSGSGMEKYRSGINIPDPQHWAREDVGLGVYLFV